MKTLFATLLLSSAVVSGVAMAGDKCGVPKADWQSEEAFRTELTARGWEIKRFKIDGGCYEIYGYDEQKRKVEAYFNPQTFEVVKMKRED